LASGGNDNTIRLWDAITGQMVQRLHSGKTTVHDLEFSPDGRRLVGVEESARIRVWDVPDRTLVRRIPLPSRPQSVTFVDNRFLLIGLYNGPIHLLDLESGDVVKTFHGHLSAVRALTISPDGLTLASGSEDGTVRLWQMSTGAELLTLKTTGARINDVAFSPDGRILAAASHDGKVLLWDGTRADKKR
jgi:WD40 repeat protein